MKNSLLSKAFALAVAIAFPMSPSLFAELPDEVKSVLERYIEASGGRELLSEVKSIRMEGEFAIPAMGMKGKSIIVQSYPDKLYAEQEIPGIGRMIQAFDGEKGWSEDPMQGFRLLTEGEIATLKQNESFEDMLNYEELYASGEIVEESVVDGEPVVAVKLVDAEIGEEQTRYFSKQSGLLKKVEMVADMGPMGKLPASTVIKTYAEEGGMRYPSELEVMNAGIPIVMTFVSLEINPEIDSSLFETP